MICSPGLKIILLNKRDYHGFIRDSPFIYMSYNAKFVLFLFEIPVGFIEITE